jgi:hypothetical protein
MPAEIAEILEPISKSPMSRILHPVVVSARRATRPMPVDIGKERNDVRWATGAKPVWAVLWRAICFVTRRSGGRTTFRFARISSRKSRCAAMWDYEKGSRSGLKIPHGQEAGLPAPGGTFCICPALDGPSVMRQEICRISPFTASCRWAYRLASGIAPRYRPRAC